MRRAERRAKRPDSNLAVVVQEIRRTAEILQWKGRDREFEELFEGLAKLDCRGAIYDLSTRPASIFEIFIVALLVVRTPDYANGHQDFATALPLWLGALLELGDYDACLKLSSLGMDRLNTESPKSAESQMS